MNIYEAMLGYYQVFTKRIKSLPQEPPISRYYYPSDGQKNGELLFATGVHSWHCMLFLRTLNK